MGGNLSFEMSRCLRIWLVLGNFRSFSLTVARTRWWSLKMSAVLRHLPLMITWSIWLDVLPSGDLQVSLWSALCGKMVPPIMQLLVAQKSISLSPSSFISPHPCVPITLLLLLLSAPTLALKSQIVRSRLCCGTWAKTDWSCSYQSSFTSRSVSLFWCVALQDGEAAVLGMEACSK